MYLRQAIMQGGIMLALMRKAQVFHVSKVRMSGSLLASLFLLLASTAVWAGKQAGVAYLADQEVDEKFELYWVDPKTGAVQKLNSALGADRDVVYFQIGPKGKSLIYLADQNEDQRFELFHVDLKTKQVTNISGLGNSANPFSSVETSPRPQIGPKGKIVVFSADVDVDGKFELYRVVLKTGQIDKINAPLAADGDVRTFSIGPKGRYIGYTDKATTSEAYLWSAKTGKAERIHPQLPAWAAVLFGVTFDQKGKYVLFAADIETNNTYDLYQFDIKTAALSRLTQGLPSGARTSAYPAPSKNSVFVHISTQPPYVANLFHLDLKTDQRKLVNAFLVPGGSVGGVVAGSKRRYVYYTADQDVDDLFNLYRRDRKTGTLTKLDQALSPGLDVFAFLVDEQQRFAVYSADLDVDDEYELYLVDLKTLVINRLSADLPTGRSVHPWRFSMDSKGRSVVYLADQDSDDVNELYRVETATGIISRISGNLTNGGNVTEVQVVGQVKTE